MKHGMWTAGVDTLFEITYRQKSKNYTIKYISVQNIKCPTLVLEAEKDDSFPGQPKKVIPRVNISQKIYHIHRRRRV